VPASPILFLSHVAELGGAENVLLDLLAALDRDRFTPHLGVPGDGPLAQRAAALGCGVHELPLAARSPWAKALRALRARGAIRRLGDGLGCRLLVANSMIAGYAAVRARRPDLPCVWHLHIVTDNLVARSALRRADAVIAPSRIALTQARVAAGEVIPNGVPDRYFAANGSGLRAELGVPEGAPLLGIVGRLDPRKGHEVLLRAMADWPDQPQPHLVVAGGELFASSQARLVGVGQRLRALADQLGVAARVHWLGDVDDTAGLLAQLDVLAVPSTGLESAPRTIAEAQAAGCPVVASDVGGVPEMLENGAAGRLVPPGDPGALQKALRHVVHDGGWRAQAVGEARRRAEQNYRPDAFARRCEAVFGRLVDAAIGRSRS
jgi:glycosyltransferase involved in cell wall biosynthesis